MSASPSMRRTRSTKVSSAPSSKPVWNEMSGVATTCSSVTTSVVALRCVRRSASRNDSMPPTVNVVRSGSR